eukprot:CAMPEP_0206063350 /NCGR_PEP_ID=MMETSP1466-20131121/58185_1 /ASSEMBLY_ACC=CAM_ASM_001126 /TAXON_ID=44452 /ORGANISM="Pavlova gyrans, Strain CCMP608" /LENGTH=272 /DNA_ID=CAMNT_0053438719 /DNA_START=683 /DNA_END=1503 /DNA_ORIENTATION=+
MARSQPAFESLPCFASPPKACIAVVALVSEEVAFCSLRGDDARPELALQDSCAPPGNRAALALEPQVGEPPRLDYRVGVAHLGVDFVGVCARGADGPGVDCPPPLPIAAPSVGAIAAAKLVVDVHIAHAKVVVVGNVEALGHDGDLLAGLRAPILANDVNSVTHSVHGGDEVHGFGVVHGGREAEHGEPVDHEATDVALDRALASSTFLPVTSSCFTLKLRIAAYSSSIKKNAAGTSSSPSLLQPSRWYSLWTRASASAENGSTTPGGRVKA